MIDFGKRVKDLRLEQDLTKEEFCGDESELSVRQLTRIESGASMPTLAKVEFIAERLGVKIGDLTDPEQFELPKRYKEIKYTLLRTQTFGDPSRVCIKEQYFDEIYQYFFDNLPEEEQVVVAILETSLRLSIDGETFSANKLLNEYLNQAINKTIYSINDIILLNLYLLYLTNTDFSANLFNKEVYNQIIANLIKHVDILPLEELFILNRTLANIFRHCIMFEDEERMKKVLQAMNEIMEKTQDFQKKPILSLMEWKYYLKKGEQTEAKRCYQEACLFAKIIQDNFLIENLKEEWEKDTQQ